MDLPNASAYGLCWITYFWPYYIDMSQFETHNSMYSVHKILQKIAVFRGKIQSSARDKMSENILESAKQGQIDVEPAPNVPPNALGI